MKKIYLKRVFLLVVFSALLQSCKNDESAQVFSDVPSVRLQKEIQKVQNLLTSSTNGWKVTYFTDTTQLGGFTYLFKFINDTRVKMQSDAFLEKSASTGGKDIITTSESEYRIVAGSTVKLSFSTGTKIHQLSNSDRYPTYDLKGKGYKGDFEFLYYGQDGEDLIFRTNRDFIKLRFKKATEGDWKDHHLIMKNNEMISHITSTDKIFKMLNVGGNLYSFSYDKNSRFGKGLNESLEKKEINFGVGFTPTGIVINPAIKVDGKEIKSFIYNETDKKFIAKIDGVQEASIYSENKPFFVPRYNFDEENPRMFGLMTTIFPGEDISSKGFLNLFNGWKQDFQAATNKKISSINIYFKDDNSSTPYLSIMIKDDSAGTNLFPWFDIQYTITEDPVTGTDIIKFTPTGNSNPNGMEAPLKPITDFFFRNKGFYMYQTGKLQEYTDKKIGLIPVDGGAVLMDFVTFG